MVVPYVPQGLFMGLSGGKYYHQPMRMIHNVTTDVCPVCAAEFTIYVKYCSWCSLKLHQRCAMEVTKHPFKRDICPSCADPIWD